MFSLFGGLKPLKQANPGLILGVAGCLAQQEQNILMKRIPHLDFIVGPDAVESIQQIVQRVSQGEGPESGVQHHGLGVADLAAAVLKNPKYGGNTRYNQFHHMLMARIARAFGRNEATLAHLGRAMDLMPTDKLNMMTVTALVDGGRFDEAREFIEDATHRLPAQPLRRIASQKNLEELMLYVNEMEKLADEERGRDIGD